MYELPTTVEVAGIERKIRNDGDFRMVLDCFSVLNDVDLTKQERAYCALIIFYEGIDEIQDIDLLLNTEEAITQMYKFFNLGEEEVAHTTASPKLIDWEADSNIICSAINNVINDEIRLKPYVHWWTFMGYYMAVGQSTLSTIVGIRSKIKKGKKLEKWEQEFKRDNPKYFVWDAKTATQKEDDLLALSLWNKDEGE